MNLRNLSKSALGIVESGTLGRCLATTSSNCSRLVLRNVSRRISTNSLRDSQADVVRYSSIREFFRRNLVIQQRTASAQRAQVPFAYVGLAPRPRLQSHFPALLHSRTFFSTASHRQNERSSKGDASEQQHSSQKHKPKDPDNEPLRPPDTPKEPEIITNPHLENYSRFYKRLALSVPHLHRPTRDDFLNLATNFWQRLRIRFKWFTIKSFRKFNTDDFSAFFSWFVVGQTLWILIGTTTFFSAVVWTMNSLRMQEYVARTISNYLTSETGATVVFESAIVPKWKDSRISFKNVYISRRPKSQTPKLIREHGHRAVARMDVGDHPATYHDPIDDEEEVVQPSPDEDTNYSMFDLDVDSVDVTLSLWRWLDGKGLVSSAEIKGVRGVVDRRNVHYDPDKPLNPADFRHQARPGDFELESLKLEDVLVTIYQPGDFRPYTASIFQADLRCLRKQWFIYDFLSAENIVGQVDNCLFSLHKPQSIGRTMEDDMKDGLWKRMSRFRIDGVNIDHIKRATTEEGGLISWITSGKVDAVLDIKFPRDPSNDFDINALMTEIASNITGAAKSAPNSPWREGGSERIPGQRELAKPALVAPSTEEETEVKPRHLLIDIDLRFRDLKAAVPLFTQDLSYVNNALIRPIVAFINANRTLVPIRCRVIRDLSDFDGAWTLWETGILDDISVKTYEALAYHVSNANVNHRIRKVSLWSIQVTANAVLSALRNATDPVSSHLRSVYAPA